MADAASDVTFQQTALEPSSRITTLEEAAEVLAQQHEVRSGRHPKRLPLLASPQTYIDFLERAHRQFSRAAEGAFVLSYAGEWLLDNYYLVQQAFSQIEENLPTRFYRQLPPLASGVAEGYPRIYSVAWALIERTACLCNLAQIEEFVEGYQKHRELTMGELWALPMMLRVGVLEILCHAIALSTDIKAPRTPDYGPLLQQQISTDTIVANCVTSLRMLGTIDWKVYFEDVSLVERILRRDPAGIYPMMDFETRNRYRKAIEALATSTHQSEVETAANAITLAERAKPEQEHPSREAHVGYYLVGQGWSTLESELGYHPPIWINLLRLLRQHVLGLYLAATLFLTLLFTGLALAYAILMRGSFLQIVVVALLSIIPASSAATAIVNWAATRSAPPTRLPKMDFEEGIPVKHRALVVMPTLLSSIAEVDALSRHLEMQYLRNSDEQVRYALLADLLDAPSENLPEDEALTKHAVAAINALNMKYGSADHPSPFYLLLRSRQWNPSEGLWMGWERKRGKLMDLNRLLLRQDASVFTTITGDVDLLAGIRYVITVDEDTVLPKDTVRRLVGTLAHPLNEAKFVSGTNLLEAGYTVLQPRVEVLPTAAARSRFAAIFAGDTAIDLYSRAVSDVYQDLFGEGIYVGKGIYDVEAFDRSLAGLIPENTLLSHDLFEGICGRAALATDIVLLEDYPSHYLAYAMRVHRWTRGDWQLLPWLLPWLFPYASLAQSHLSLLDRWKIIDNLRRSLVQPALLLWILLGWLWLPGSAAIWSLIATATASVPFLMAATSDLVAAIPSLFKPLTSTRSDTRLARWALFLILLPHQALLRLDAVFTTLVRLVQRRHLLQWTPAAHVSRLLGE